MSILNYRLGDIIKFNKNIPSNNDNGYKYHLNLKNTLASEYLNKTDKINDYDTLINIIKKKYSLQINDEVIIHLRLGDILCTKFSKFCLSPAYAKLPLDPLLFSKVINNLININDKKVIILGDHKNNCIKETENYINILKKNIPNLFISNNSNPDLDIIRMVNAKIFIKGKGGFSDIVYNLRVKLNRKNIINKHLSYYNVCGIYFKKDIICLSYSNILYNIKNLIFLVIFIILIYILINKKYYYYNKKNN